MTVGYGKRGGNGSLWTAKNSQKCKFDQFLNFGPSAPTQCPPWLNLVWDGKSKVFSSLPKIIFIGTHCHPCGVKTAKNAMFLSKFWNKGTPAPIPSPTIAKFGTRQYTHGVCFSTKFQLYRFIVSPWRDEKHLIWGYFQCQHSVVMPPSRRCFRLRHIECKKYFPSYLQHGCTIGLLSKIMWPCEDWCTSGTSLKEKAICNKVKSQMHKKGTYAC